MELQANQKRTVFLAGQFEQQHRASKEKEQQLQAELETTKHAKNVYNVHKIVHISKLLVRVKLFMF